MDGARRSLRRLLGHDLDPKAEAIGAATLVALLAAARAWWPVDVSPRQWWGGAVVVLAIALVLRHPRVGPHRLRGWLALAGLSVLLAAMFWAANRGLDLIKPPGSRRSDAAATIFGFELWTMLCPGLAMVALAGFARALARRSHRG